MTNLKVFVFALIVGLSGLCFSCSDSNYVYSQIKELAEKETLTPEEMNQATEALIVFYGEITKEGVTVAKNAKSEEDIEAWQYKMEKKYPAARQLYRNLNYNFDSDEIELIIQAKDNYLEAIKNAYKFTHLK